MAVARPHLWIGARAAVSAILLVGCDGIFDLTHVRPPDASVIDGAPDAPWDALWELGFSAPMPVMGLQSSALDGDPTLPTDMLEIYFKSDRPGGMGKQDIWYATRATTADPWSAPQVVTELATVDYENAPRIAPDGLTMWFRRSPAAGGTGSTMITTRSSRTGTWSAPMTVPVLDGTLGDGQFMSSSPGQTVAYLSSKRPSGSDKLRVFRAERASSSDPWGTPVEVSELLGSESYIQGPWVTPDDLTMIVSMANRPGCHVDGVDLWLFQRATTQDPFGAPLCLSEAMTLAFDADPWISPDLRHIYFTSTATGNYDLFEAHR